MIAIDDAGSTCKHSVLYHVMLKTSVLKTIRRAPTRCQMLPPSKWVNTFHRRQTIEQTGEQTDKTVKHRRNSCIWEFYNNWYSNKLGQSKGSELDNVSKWALTNNLRLNKAKCVEIVFTDSRCKLQICQPPTIPDIQRVTSVSILGVTISRLSVSEYVQSVISKCAQSMHALKILRSHGMNSDALKVIYKSVVLTKLLYACWGFGWTAWSIPASRSQAQPVQRSRPLGVTTCAWYYWRWTLQCCDVELSSRATTHVTWPYTFHPYTLRPRRHDCSLTAKEDSRNFVIRLLFKDMYYSFNFISIFTSYCSLAFWQLIINYYYDDDVGPTTVSDREHDHQNRRPQAYI